MQKLGYTFFKHDVDTFFDEKVMRMFCELGWQGYGIFNRLIEILYSDRNHRIPINEEDFAVFCHLNHLPVDETRRVVTGFDLFIYDDKFFRSARVDETVAQIEERYETRKENGRKGGLKSASLRTSYKTTQAPLKKDLSTPQQDKKRKDKIRNIYSAKVESVLRYFNQVTGKNIRLNSPYNQKHVNARLAEGFTEEDCQQVIRTKYQEWKDDEEMRKFIRIETLFSNKFESYLNQGEKKEKTGIERFMKND